MILKEMDDLATAKNLLFESLGDEFRGYMILLKLWFKGSLDKDGFDREAKNLLKSKSKLNLHNKFLISVYNKCQNLAGAKSDINKGADLKLLKNGKQRNKVVKACDGRRFTPVDQLEYLTPVKMISDLDYPKEFRKGPGKKIIRLSFCTNDGMLPDNFSTHLRIFVNIWEEGLDEVKEDAVKLVNLSIRVFIKNILQTVISYKSNFRINESNKKMKYAFGSQFINPFIRNSDRILRHPQDFHTTLTDDSGQEVTDVYSNKSMAESDALYHVACSNTISLRHNSQQNKRRHDANSYPSESCEKITLHHLFQSLKLHPNTIPSHTIYSVSMSRIISRISPFDGPTDNSDDHLKAVVS